MNSGATAESGLSDFLRTHCPPTRTPSGRDTTAAIYTPRRDVIARVRVAGSAAADAGHVHQRADVRGGRRDLRRPLRDAGPDRVNVRNGYRHRDFDTRADTLDVAIPKLRSGSYFPDWLLERRRRAEPGADQRGGDVLPARSQHAEDGKLVESLGITRLSRSQVSEMARDLDAQVEAFRSRPLEPGRVVLGIDAGAPGVARSIRHAGRTVS
ncbi:MAG: transposase [Streptosporangiaceae bacterium]